MNIKDIIIGKLAKQRVNVFWTLFINFTSFPLKTAIKFPIICYGRLRVISLAGRISIDAPIKKGMIRIGADVAHYRTAGATTLNLGRDSLMKFTGPFVVSQGASIVLGQKAVLSLGEYSGMGENAEIICMKEISIGDHTDLTWQTQVTDTGTHCILNRSTNMVSSIYNPVKIGSYCWICNRTTIQPGVILPDKTIVGSNSLVNKSFADVDEGTLIAGIPAKVINGNIFRIYEKQKEAELMNYFRNNNVPFYEYNK